MQESVGEDYARLMQFTIDLAAALNGTPLIDPQRENANIYFGELNSDNLGLLVHYGLSDKMYVAAVSINPDKEGCPYAALDADFKLPEIEIPEDFEIDIMARRVKREVLDRAHAMVGPPNP